MGKELRNGNQRREGEDGRANMLGFAATIPSPSPPACLATAAVPVTEKGGHHRRRLGRKEDPRKTSSPLREPLPPNPNRRYCQEDEPGRRRTKPILAPSCSATAAAVTHRRVPSLLSERSSFPPFCCSGLPPPPLEIRPIWSEGKKEVQAAAATCVVSCCTSHRHGCRCWRRELRPHASGHREWFRDFRDPRQSSRLSLCRQEHLGCHRVPFYQRRRTSLPSPENSSVDPPEILAAAGAVVGAGSKIVAASL
ncbi:uncharacterized protein DS421_1g33160 [Arachis hypogaea]|nr:uncharacterized protein DS421_1g33160 [Arachis hypogaea]